MSRLTLDGTAEPVSRHQILRHQRGQGNIHFFCSPDHEQHWQPYLVDLYDFTEACVCDHGYERSDLCAEIIIRTYIIIMQPGATNDLI